MQIVRRSSIIKIGTWEMVAYSQFLEFLWRHHVAWHRLIAEVAGEETGVPPPHPFHQFQSKHLYIGHKGIVSSHQTPRRTIYCKPNIVYNRTWRKEGYTYMSDFGYGYGIYSPTNCVGSNHFTYRR
jgi:hypothetical protein